MVSNSGSNYSDPYTKLPNPPLAETPAPAAATPSAEPAYVTNQPDIHRPQVKWYPQGSPDKIPRGFLSQIHQQNGSDSLQNRTNKILEKANSAHAATKPVQNSSTTNVSGTAPLTAAEKKALLLAAMGKMDKTTLKDAVATAGGGAAPVAGPNGKALFNNVMATQVAIPSIDKSGKLTLHVAAGATYKPAPGGMHIVGGVAIPIHQVIVHDDAMFHSAVTERAESLGIMFQPDPRFMQQMKAQVHDGRAEKSEKSTEETIAAMKGHRHLVNPDKTQDRTGKQNFDRARAQRQLDIKDQQAQESKKKIEQEAADFRKGRVKAEQHYQTNKKEESAATEKRQEFDEKTGRTE